MERLYTIFLKSVFCSLTFLFIISSARAQNTAVADSLSNLISKAADDTNKLNLYNDLFFELRNNNPSHAVEIAEQHLKLAQTLQSQKGIANGYNNLGLGNFNLGNYDKALDYNLRALKIRETASNPVDLATSYNNLGLVYNRLKQYTLALQYHLKSLQIRTSLNDKKGVSNSYNNIGLVYLALGDTTKALESHFKSFELKKELKDKKGMSQSLNNIGTVYIAKNQPDKALEYLFQSMSIKQEINDKNGMAASYNNIGDVYVKKAEFRHNNADYDNAIRFYTKSLDIGLSIKLKEIVKTNYEGLSQAYHKKGDDAKAYEFYQKFIALKDSMLNEDIAKNEAEMQTKYDTDKKQKEIELLNKDVLLQATKQKTTRNFIVSGIILALVIIGFLVNRFYVNRKANTILTQKNKLIDQSRTELRSQNDIIERKNKDITDSIDYAKDIQNLILPSDKEMLSYFPDSFICYLPKSIVSGDFYWLHQTENKTFIAAIDCTGHGVPGAMMSFLGHSIIENVVKNKKITQPALVLKELNNEVFATLSYKNENISSKYGMDISLAAIDTQAMQIHFAAAHNALYLLRDGNLHEYKGDRISIGAFAEEKGFTQQIIPYQKGDTIYLFTDGFPDQIGGTERRKFYYNPFKELIQKVSFQPMQQQNQMLKNALVDWRGKRDQTDDILIIGIKL